MRRPLLVPLLCIFCLALPGLAHAASVTSDCNANGRLTQRYSTQQLRVALATMPADVKEYTNCYDVIHRALLIQIGAPRQGSISAPPASSGSSVSIPLIAALILLAVAAVTGIVAFMRRRRA